MQVFSCTCLYIFPYLSVYLTFFLFCSLFPYTLSIVQDTRKLSTKAKLYNKMSPPIQYSYLLKLLKSEYLKFLYSELGFKLFFLMHEFYSWKFRREHFCQTTVQDLGKCINFSKWMIPKSIQIVNTFSKMEIY